MKMCNRNSGNDKTIKLDQDGAYFKFKGNQYSFNKRDIKAGECIEIIETEQIDKCKAYPMAVQLEGYMPERQGNGNGNAYCNAFKFHKMRSKKFEQPKTIPPQVFENRCTKNGANKVCKSKVRLERFVQYVFLSLLSKSH